MSISVKRYELVTSSCFVAAIVSSLLYGKMGTWDAGVMILGVAAAIGAVAAYFYNAHHASEKSTGVVVVASDAPDLDGLLSVKRVAAASEGTSTRWPAVPVAGKHIRYRWAQGSKATVPASGAVWHLKPGNRIQELHGGRYYYMAGVNFGQPEPPQPLVQDKQQAFVEQVVGIVERLSSSCEFEFHVDKGLTIRPVRVAKAGEKLPDKSLPQGLDLGDLLNRPSSEQVH